MSHRERTRFVGAGIAGLTLAIALDRHGFRVELIERSSEWDAPGAGIAVQPNGMRVLHELGIGTAVEDAGAVLRRWRVRDQLGEMLCDIGVEALWGGVGAMIGIERIRLEEALRGGAAAVPPPLRTWVTSFHQGERRLSVQAVEG